MPYPRLHSVVALCAGAVLLGAASARADSEADFFKDRTVTVVVPTGSGGTYHIYGQIVQRHIGKHIPGNPSVILQNRQGAGGATAAAYMMHVAAKDGTVISEMTPGMLTDPLIRPQLKYDATKFNYLGSIAARPFVIAVWHTAPAKTFDDLRTHEVILGTNGRASTGYVLPVFINAVLGTKMKVITGYKSGGETNLAMERGEIHGRGNYYSGFVGVRPEWIRDHKLRFLLQIGPKHPLLKDVPHVRDYLKPGTMEAKLYDLLEVNFNVGQAFFAPPGMPAQRLATLRKAFVDMLADPETRAETEKRGIEFMPEGHEHIEKLIADGYKAAEPPVVKRLREVMGVDGKEDGGKKKKKS